MKTNLTGTISVWRYKGSAARNYPGYHITADRCGCELLLQSIELLLSSTAQSFTVSLSEPTLEMLEIPNNMGGKAPYVAYDEMRVALLQEDVPKLGVEIVEPGICLMRASRTAILEFRDGVKDIFSGEGDWTMGAETETGSITFWWFPGPKDRVKRR